MNASDGYRRQFSRGFPVGWSTIAVLSMVAAAPARADSITAKWTFDRSEVRLEKEGEYTRVFLHDGMSPEETPGYPSLPARYVFVVIPAGASPTGLTVDGVETPLAGDILVWPIQPPYSTNDPPPAFVPPDSTAYASDQPTPAAQAVIQGTHRLHGYTLVSLRLNPLRYVPTARALSLATEIDVTLSFTDPDPAVVASLHAVPRGNAEVAGLVANPQDVDRFAPPGGPATPRDQSAVYLLITSNNLAAAFQPLVDRRTAQGKPGTLLTTEWICANYDGTRPDGDQDNQTRIRNCIKDYYLNHGTVWVALGGDDTVVPVRYCRGCITECYDNLPADLYYGGLDGSWDEDGDGIYGEVGDDNADLYPEVWLGRIPTRTPEQASAYATKVQTYENAPADGYASTMLLSGCMEWWTGLQRSPGYQYHEPVDAAEWYLEEIYRNSIQPHWQATPLDRFFNTITTWDSATCGDYAQSYDHLVTRLSYGYQHILNMAHGNAYGWVVEETWVSSQLASVLTNVNRPSIVYTISCDTGGFDEGEPSLSEAFLRNPGGGAVVYLGSARTDWTPPRYVESFYQQVLEYRRATIGEACARDKMSWAPAAGGNSVARWLQFARILQGDPALVLLGPAGGRHLQVYVPNGCEVIDSDADLVIRWNASGTDFAANENVRLDNSADGGNSWQAIPGAEAFPFDACLFTWESPSLPPGSQYRVRVSSLADPDVSDASDGNFIIGPTRVLTVNSTPCKGLWIEGSHPNSTDYTYCPLVGTAVLLKAPSVDGYNFTGWAGINGNLLTRQTNLSFVLSGNRTVTARYEPIGAPRDYYVNDDVAEPGFAAGTDENDGRSPDNPVRHIQQIIDRYDDIATIHVSPGTYIENIAIGPTRSEVVLQGAAADTTIIDGNQSGPCLRLNGATHVTIRGFTIQNGAGSWGGGLNVSNCSGILVSENLIRNNSAYVGAGIAVLGNSEATVAGNRIYENSAASGGSGWAGGIYVEASVVAIASNDVWGNQALSYGGGLGIYNANSVIMDNTIQGNLAHGGAGIAVCDRSEATVVGNRILQNSATLGNTDNWGGGMYVDAAEATIADNEIRQNQARYTGGGLSIYATNSVTVSGNSIVANGEDTDTDYGGGVSVWYAGVNLHSNLIESNSALYGGGVALLYGATSTIIRDNRITSNTSSVLGAGVYSGCATAQIENSLIGGNATSGPGGGVSLYYSSPAIRNCTIVANTALQDGGAVFCQVSSPTISNSILWANQSGEIHVDSGASMVNYSTVQGGWSGGGTGNQELDPQFVAPDGPDNDPATWEDNDYRLSAGSPCIDAGDPAFVSQPGETDLDGRRRVWDGDNDGAARVDMGAYEYASQVCGDVNCDGEVNLDDAAPFVLALIDEIAYEATYPACDRILADLNGDGSVNGSDIQSFIEVMLNPPGGRKGDLNDDGVVDLADVNVLVTVLLGADSIPLHVRRADLNGDGAADGLDIQPFLSALLTP